jgi:hypothetical protein
MAGGKRAPEGRGKPSCKLTVIVLELKIKMIHKYEGGQSSSEIARELGFAISL